MATKQFRAISGRLDIARRVFLSALLILRNTDAIEGCETFGLSVKSSGLYYSLDAAYIYTSEVFVGPN